MGNRVSLSPSKQQESVDRGVMEPPMVPTMTLDAPSLPATACQHDRLLDLEDHAKPKTKSPVKKIESDDKPEEAMDDIAIFNEDGDMEEPLSPSAIDGKCAKCNKRSARDGCTRYSCLQCCDDAGCEKHRKSKEQAMLKEQILSGTTEVQHMVQQIRAHSIPKGRFKETGFLYQGDTVVIWNVREYLANPKWREEAVRKSIRRKPAATLRAPNCKPKLSRRQRFRRLVAMKLKEATAA